ncbi:D-lactate dehydrogenase (cytochrome) [Thermosporothrix hazakensis]|uniref:D-lactate dehydrogenase (Cytochrome) n=1 Tax=Thermosporothrix hazakensis TaxID=644383 RepID=A0A326TNU0_THEHA|nr:FAD-binding oxidoreductase [Thermosporothrix hazakensis]PZW18025.1 D-lactate dehydrogenase (cytochrome) [Thermosporothrix hazakensis]GCE48036.1 lactate dehydrogenase [Thermosporothrix hazakensis]
MLQEDALQALKALLPQGQIFTDRASLIAYEVDAGVDKGNPEGVVFPRTVEDVQRIVRWATEYHVPLIGRGAGTGLSGGAVADRGGVIVQFSYMNHIRDIDIYGRSIVVEPALINLHLDTAVSKFDLYFPPDPSSQRASTIGGNVSENSGGPHCFKYGVTTNYITGLQVVLADGKSVRIGGKAFDYPEYDLCGLLTGGEGTLGLLTCIYGRLIRKPPAVKTMLVVFDSVEQAGEAVSAIIAAGLVPATMEMMDQKISQIIEPFAQAGLPLDAEAILIIEVDGYPESLDAQIEEIVQILKAHGGSGIRVARNEEERTKIWLARKSAAGAVTRLSPSYYTVDVTVPRSKLAQTLAEVNQIIDHYGLRAGHLLHAGDGNLHPMILIPDPEDPELMKRIHQAGHDMVACCVRMGGSLSGEHGIGIEKRDYMPLMHSQAELMAMWDVKQAFDAQNIFNPGKIFPTPEKGEASPFTGYSSRYQTPLDETYQLKLSETGTFEPDSAEEAARGLLYLTNHDQRAHIGAPAYKQENDIQINTSALRGIREFAPDDLYITVGAGTPLKEVQDYLAQEQKWLALEAPWAEATLGGLIAANINSPLRMRYGAIREQVLCTTVALADGRVIRTGRPIVKNVAGYDLTKPFVGSYGTLGLLCDVTLKLTVPPRSRRSILIGLDDLPTGFEWSQKLLQRALNMSSLVLCKGVQASVSVPHGKYLLACTVEGHPGDVELEIQQAEHLLHEQGCEQITIQDALHGVDLWKTLLTTNEDTALQVRVGLPLIELPAFVQKQSTLLEGVSFLADLASGLLYLTYTPETEAQTWLQAIRQEALTKEGYAIVTNGPLAIRQGLDPWGYVPEALSVMRALKARWDPQGILNNGMGFPSTLTSAH